jgi:CO/xanthine dehydrogenase FAD-binding subunit
MAGCTDLYVALNLGTLQPARFLDLWRLDELRRIEARDGVLSIGALVTYADLLRSPLVSRRAPMLAMAAREVGGVQIRNRGTLGGNLGTASPAGDALPPLLVYAAEVVCGSVRGVRTLPLEEFLVGPKQNALAEDELILAVRVEARPSRQTFMKVGPRNAMVIAVVSLALAVDEERGEVRASYGSAGPVPGLVVGSLEEAHGFAERVAEHASPIDDVRGTARYRRHALRVLVERALERCRT